MNNIIVLTILAMNYAHGLVSIESLEDRVRNGSAVVVVAILKQSNIVRISDGEYLELMELEVKDVVSKSGSLESGATHLHMLRTFKTSEAHFKRYDYDPQQEYIVSLDIKKSTLHGIYFSFADYWERPLIASAETIAELKGIASKAVGK